MGAASIWKRPLIKKYYLTPYFCGLYSRAACNQERLLMARLRYLKILNIKFTNLVTSIGCGVTFGLKDGIGMGHKLFWFNQLHQILHFLTHPFRNNFVIFSFIGITCSPLEQSPGFRPFLTIQISQSNVVTPEILKNKWKNMRNAF